MSQHDGIFKYTRKNYYSMLGSTLKMRSDSYANFSPTSPRAKKRDSGK